MKKYEKLHFEAMELTAPGPKSSGLGPQKLTPWGFEGLGLLDLLLVALILEHVFRR